jgi:hypothetical protein
VYPPVNPADALAAAAENGIEMKEVFEDGTCAVFTPCIPPVCIGPRPHTTIEMKEVFADGKMSILYLFRS